MRIGALFAILTLLLCTIAVRGEQPIVIKDSEAIQYVGKEVEVRGRVASVTTSPLGTTFSTSEETTPIRDSADSLQPGRRSQPISDLP